MRTGKCEVVSILAIIALWACGFMNAYSQERVRAKIGILIRSGDKMIRAKSRDTLSTGDFIRIYVYPEGANSYLYVIHADGKSASLLNMTQQRIQSSTLVLPSLREFYQPDGQSPVETFTIICSPTEVKELSNLLGGEIPYEKWAPIEKNLLQQGTIDLGQKTEKPFAIAGNVRSTGDALAGDPFAAELQIFSGNAILVKQYEFRVKK
ncbi:MAG TPA: hypothetical protein VE398_15595 [Acidobacteriota bacterium]|nr:hypothetical protein [Acidobacteriota bacterium]